MSDIIKIAAQGKPANEEAGDLVSEVLELIYTRTEGKRFALAAAVGVLEIAKDQLIRDAHSDDGWVDPADGD